MINQVTVIFLLKLCKLKNFIDINGFKNTISDGTRLNPTTGKLTLLDVILCLFASFFIVSSSFSYPCSDHKLVVSLFKHKSIRNKYRVINTRCLNTPTLDKIKEELLFYFTHTDNSRIKDPDTLWLKFSSIRNLFKSKFRQAKALHFKDFIGKNSTSSPKLWSYINPLLNPNKKSVFNASDLIHGNVNSSPQDKANMFSNFFDSVLNKFVFISISLCLDYISSVFESSESLLKTTNMQVKFSFRAITDVDVKEFLTELDELSAPGLSGIESKLIKHCADSLIQPLVELFNLCISTNQIPSEWKVAYVTPVLKPKSLKSSLDSYRPISVITPIAKIFERLLDTQIRDYLESNFLLHDNQFGFRKSRSCELALNTIISSVKHSLDDKDNVVAVLLDLSKAFDTVDHVLMLHKLHLFGFSPSSIALIKDYLSNRFNITKFGDCSSSPKLVEVGIPQGSILGVILFIIFINDMCHLDISSNLTLFADDTTMIYSHKSISICLKTLSSDLAVIEKWLKHNRLILNLKKTNAMLFSNGCRSNLIDDNIKLESNGINIPFVTSFKLLGVIVDNKLKFDLHTISICRKVCFKIHT